MFSSAARRTLRSRSGGCDEQQETQHDHHLHPKTRNRPVNNARVGVWRFGPTQESSKLSVARCGYQLTESSEHEPTNRSTGIRRVGYLWFGAGSSCPGPAPTTPYVVPRQFHGVLPLRHVVGTRGCVPMGHECLPHVVFRPARGRQRSIHGRATDRCVGRRESASR